MIASTPTIEALQDELAALRQRVAELEYECDQARQSAELYQAIFQYIPISIQVNHLEQPEDPRSLRLVAANAAMQRTSKVDVGAKIGMRMVEVYPNVPDSMLQINLNVVRTGQPRDMGEVTYHVDDEHEVIYATQLIPLPHNHIASVLVNVTERKRAEEALRQSIALEETIQAQNAVLAELSTPLIPISDQVVAMPLIGSVDSRRAQQVIETLLQGIAASGARVAILDITGVPVVDTQVADALIRAAQAVKLLGAQVVLTGIRPEVAQTLVGLGTDLRGIVTRSSLQSGIAYATNSNEQ
jgi:rsbT co-antagonist protein RsbR